MAGTWLAPNDCQELNRDPQLALKASAIYVAGVHGWRLVPCLPGSKKPHWGLLPGGKWGHLKQQPTTQEMIEEWFSQDPNLNIAVITGPASNGLSMVDIDHPEQWPYVPLNAPSPCIMTARGERWLYEAPRGQKQYKEKWGELLYGGYALLPPSLHPSGVRLNWKEGHTPWEVTCSELPELLHRKRVPRSPPPPAPAPSGSSLGRDALRTFYSQEAIVLRCAAFFGVNVSQVGQAFPCILPGHDEAHPSASFWQGDNGIYIYHDFHCRDGIEVFTLPEVYASRVLGKVVTFRDHKGLQAIWGIRLLYEIEAVKPAEVTPLRYPAACAESIYKVASGIRLLFSLRWLHSPLQPAPLSRRFLADWCGISEPKATYALKYLVSNGSLVPIGKSKTCPTYLPAQYVDP